MAKNQKSELVRIDSTEKIARALAIISVKDLDKEEAARRLLAVGFDAKQIGGLLDVNQNFANVAKTRKPKPRGKG